MNAEHVIGRHNQLQERVNDTQVAVSDLGRQLDMTQDLVQSNSSLLKKISSILTP